MSDDLNLINGYMVVRKPQFNLAMQDEAQVLEPLTINSREVYYRGVERSAWYDIQNEYYTKAHTQLPEIRNWFEQLTNSDITFFTGLWLVKELDTSLKYLNYANVIQPKNELIVIYSESLEKYCGTPIASKAKIDWKGYDIFSLRQWSLIVQGIFFTPQHFTQFLLEVNEHGLFSTPDVFQDYVTHYKALSRKNFVEEIDLPGTSQLARDGIIIKVGTVVIE